MKGGYIMFGKKKDAGLCAKLVDGLPVPQVVTVYMYMNTSMMLFTIDKNQKFELSLEKVTSVRQYNETEIENIVSQSAPGMIIGAAAFGVLGAMVGGRVKTKKKKVVKYYIVIKYDDKEIMVETEDYVNCMKFVRFFNDIKPQDNSVVTL